MVAASDRDGVMFSLFAGNCGDAPEGRSLLQQLGPVEHPVHLLMDRAYEGDETRALAVELGYIPVVSPKSNRKNPWDYDRQLYKQRNQVERLFRRIKRFRRIFTRYDKLYVIFVSFVFWLLLLMPLCEHTRKEMHETFQGSIVAIQKWEKRQAETWGIKNKPAKRPFKKIDPERLKKYIEDHPDAYLREIAEEFGCSAPTVLKALRRPGFKKRQNITKNKTLKM